MQKVILFAFMVIVAANIVAAEQIYFIVLDNSGPEMKLASIELMDGAPQRSEGDYFFKIVGADGVLFSQNIDIPPKTVEGHIDTVFGSEAVIFDQTEVVVTAPYFEKAVEFQVSDGNTILLQENIQYLGDFCGDRVCQPPEDSESCRVDCPSGGRDYFCDGIPDNICDPDCSEQNDVDCKTDGIQELELVTPSNNGNEFLLAVLLSAVIVAIAAGLLYLKRR